MPNRPAIRRRLQVTVALFFLVLLVAPDLCARAAASEGPQRSERTFHARVDSVQVPATVTLGDTVSVRVFGFLGPNLCYGFSKFEASASGTDLRLAVEGVQRVDPGRVCAEMASVIRGRQYRFRPTRAGVCRILLERPQGWVAADSLQVLAGGAAGF